MTIVEAISSKLASLQSLHRLVGNDDAMKRVTEHTTKREKAIPQDVSSAKKVVDGMIKVRESTALLVNEGLAPTLAAATVARLLKDESNTFEILNREFEATGFYKELEGLKLES